MKKNYSVHFPPGKRNKNPLTFPFYSFVLLSIFSLLTAVPSKAQQRTIDVSYRNVTLIDALNDIKDRTGYHYVYFDGDVPDNIVVRAEMRSATLEAVLNEILVKNGFTYTLGENVISIGRATLPSRSRQEGPHTVTGTIFDSSGNPIPGAAVIAQNIPGLGAAADASGRFSLSIPSNTSNVVLTFSFVGKKSEEVPFVGQREINVKLEDELAAIDDVVVTGLFSRNRESFTGSAATYSVQELKMVGTNNILQSLKTLDPSFALYEDNNFGSDPNRALDIDIRGKASLISLSEEYDSDPNQPLIMIDGFESTLQKLNDLSMDMVLSITILKDAASTAIYGSKASNGVIVIETKRPEPGSLRVNYNANVQLAWADLSQYNLMNSREKLEYERLSGAFGSIDSSGNLISTNYLDQYTNLVEEVARGVDTYWLKEPIRFATSHRHTVFIEGGAEELRYGVSVVYGNTAGVMKGSDKENITGEVKLIYRRKNLDISNIMEVQNISFNNNTVSFKDFASANAYFRKYDETGIIRSWNKNGKNFYSPLYDMNLSSYDRGNNFGFRNNLELKWYITPKLMANGKFGISNSNEKADAFLSPFHSKFQSGYTRETRGEYNETNSMDFSYNFDGVLQYGDVFGGKHTVNAIGGARIREIKNKYSVFAAAGFTDDDFGNPNYAIGYKDGRPGYSRTTTRRASFFVNANYAFNNRYLMDLNLTHDGSSVYGVTKHFTTTWSIGLGWNLHNESFMNNVSWINFLKLRGSIGNPGNQNFTDYIAFRIYKYVLDNSNYFGSAMEIANYGNRDLDWQKTLDQNYGLDIQLFNNRLRINMDYYRKDTDPLVVYMDTPPSAGTTSRAANLGKQITKGFTFMANYQIIRNEDMIWSVRAMGRHQTYEYAKLGNSLAKFNETNQGANLRRYYDGGSPYDLWAVRSAGIDPTSGREIFITLDGRETFVHSYDDEVKIGNSTPKMEGTFGTSLYYKGFTFNIALRYRVGGQEFYQTIYDKVENISDGQRLYNRDKRALYDRWQRPGDIAKFRAIDLTDKIPMTSRFIVDKNELVGESISLGYEMTDAGWLRKARLTALSVNVSMADIFRWSTFRNERGIEYPFQRSVSIAVGLRF